MRSKICQGLVHRDDHRSKFLEVLVVGCPFFRRAPEVCHGGVIRRIRRQRMLGDPLAMGRQKGLRRCTGVLTGAIVDQKQMWRGLRQDRLEERLVTFRMKPALDALREETSREICHGSKDFVAFALATGGDLRLRATACPRVTQGAPRGTACLIFKQEQPLATLPPVKSSATSAPARR